MVSNIKSKTNAWLVNNALSYYSRVRQDSELICENLEIEDFGIQTMPEVSPPKWHLAHTSWFYETMLLKPFLAGYTEFNSKFAILFNSYYDTIGQYHPRDQRGLLSRPTVKEVYQYRQHVDFAMIELLSQEHHPQQQQINSLTILGINHEQQHQELLLTDIKHIFASNPLQPIYKSKTPSKRISLVNFKPVQFNWIPFDSGVETIGFAGQSFSYDNEGPRHKTYINSFELASRAVTNGEFLEFINDGGYQNPALWLSDAWKIVKQQQWQAPLYWQKEDAHWNYMTFEGLQSVDVDSPVCHVSYYEAAAYTRWLSSSQSEIYSGVRLPSEAEWEVAALGMKITGNFRNSNKLHPQAVMASAEYEMNTTENHSLHQMFGDVWEWTQSPYAAYPGYFAEAGPLGEYNGKFMSSQMVLRGGSCITPIDHIRATYRNFFYPHERWQFSGFRLARDLK